MSSCSSREATPQHALYSDTVTHGSMCLAFFEKLFRIAADALIEIAVPARTDNNIEHYQSSKAYKN